MIFVQHRLRVQSYLWSAQDWRRIYLHQRLIESSTAASITGMHESDNNAAHIVFHSIYVCIFSYSSTWRLENLFDMSIWYSESFGTSIVVNLCELPGSSSWQSAQRLEYEHHAQPCICISSMMSAIPNGPRSVIKYFPWALSQRQHDIMILAILLVYVVVKNGDVTRGKRVIRPDLKQINYVFFHRHTAVHELNNSVINY